MGKSDVAAQPEFNAFKWTRKLFKAFFEPDQMMSFVMPQGAQQQGLVLAE